MNGGKVYKVYLPDNSHVSVMFIGKKLELILDAYNIKYEVVSKTINNENIEEDV